MGNESLRASRSSTFRRSRRSNKSSLNGGQQYVAEDEVVAGGGASNLNQEAAITTPKPVRRMDKIRRSLSFRRKKKSSSGDTLPKSNTLTSRKNGSSAAEVTTPPNATTTSNTTNTNVNNNNNNNNTTTNSTTTNTTTAAPAPNGDSSPARPALWIDDEKRVRGGNCPFQVKYLGFVEVSDSRGMQICEAAIEKLILLDKEKKKPVKAILYVSGDSLRVVDESNKTLLVDQTIEKVSFCAPDRHHENGFAYICRDGTARRWLCYGFMAIKDTLKGATTGSTGGERLSHAVGCAFSVCLEKKQKRERENVSMEVGPNHSFTRLGSFRQASLTERLEDPQMVMPAAQPVPIKPVDNPHAIERPKPSADPFNRQNSLRGTLQMPFKRNTAAYTSLKPGELPSFQQQKLASGFATNNAVSSSTSSSSSTSNGAQSTPLQPQPVTKTSLLMQQQQQIKQQQSTSMTIAELAAQSQPTPQPLANDLIKSDTFNKINTISEIPEETFATQLDINNHNNSINQSDASLSNQLNKQLNIQTTTPQQQPTGSAGLDSTHTTGMQSILQPSSANDWPGQQPQQLQQSTTNYQSSIFATPQSIPVTPTQQQLTTASPMAVMGSMVQHTPPMAAMNTIIPQPYVYQMIPSHNVYAQHQLLQITPGTGPMQMQPLSVNNYLSSPSTASLLSSNSLLLNQQSQPPPLPAPPGGVETFEQKWAKYQAAKKQTNPFAEDIAKKYEIKL